MLHQISAAFFQLPILQQNGVNRICFQTPEANRCASMADFPLRKEGKNQSLVFFLILINCIIICRRVFQTIEDSLLDDRSDLFVFADHFFCRRGIFFGKLQNIASDAETSHHCAVKAEFHRDHARRKEIRAVRDPGTHCLNRINVRIAVLNRQTIVCIGVITRPEIIKNAKDAVVDSSAAGSTGFKQYVRMFFL